MTDEELSAAIREVQQRARARAPQGALGLEGIEAPDLMPLVHARDAAQAKVAAIGTVNPRPPGLLNSTVQTAKRAAARALDWHVREQVEFNRAAMACVEASIAAMTGMSRGLAGLAAHITSGRAAEEAHRLELRRHVQELHALCDQQAAAMEGFRSQQAGLLEAVRSQFGARVDELRHEHAGTMETVRQEQKASAEVLRQERDAQAEALRHEYGSQAEVLRQEHGAQAQALRYEYGAQVEALRYEYGAQVERLRLQQAAQFEEWRTGQSAALEEVQGRLTSAAASHVLLQERVTASISELEAVYRQQLARQEEVFREHAQAQHQDFAQALERNSVDIQKRLWEDLAKVREEFEGLIHRELRLLRQRESLPAPAPAAATMTGVSGSQAEIGIDWLHFAERFRGSQERVRGQQRRYVQRFAGTTGIILDIGCGRGEFLEALRDAGLSGLGIDANGESVDLCRSKGLRAECAELFAFLRAQADGSLAGAYCAQVIEHLAPVQVGELVRLLGAKMSRGAWVAIETPNPECLAIFATYFYADPTHTRPVPAALLRFYLEEAGFGSIAVEHMNAASDLLPAIAELPSVVQDAFFGGLDYAIFARKL